MYDYAIIGSGVSGGRFAQELTAKGARCVLIEAGREFSAKTFPRDEMDYSTQMFWGGGIEVSRDGRLGFLRAKLLGGTSIVNQALLDRFDSIAWDDWKDRSGIPFFSVDAMAPDYEAVEKSIKTSSIPVEHYNKNAILFTKGFNKLGYGWKPLTRAQDDCALDEGTDCIQCLGGCPRDSKQSSLVTGIRRAREKGLVIESQCEIQTVHHHSDHVVAVGTKADAPFEVKASKVVLAAGSLGNTAILLRSGLGAKLPALGRGFSCHPQFMSYGVFDDFVDAHKGAFQSVKSDESRFRQAGFKLENVFAPPIGTAMLIPGMGASHQHWMQKYRHFSSMEVAIRDENTGRISLNKSGKLVVEKSLTAQDLTRKTQGLNLIRELFLTAGAKDVVMCTQGFGLHLMGGCAMGSDPTTSVVDPEFRVHGHPRLIAADSSVFPSAPGINPSLSIMALSHRAARIQS